MERRNFLKGFLALAFTKVLPEVKTGFDVPFDAHLARMNIYSRQVKEALWEELNTMKFIDMEKEDGTKNTY